MGVKTRRHHNNKGHKMVKNGTTVKQVEKMAKKVKLMGILAQKRLFTLFISYSFGGHYCGVYPTLEWLYGVIEEMADEETIEKRELPALQEIQESLKEGWGEDFWHEFNNSTWIHVQETSEQLVDIIQRDWRG